jgi:hypothetical protein
MIKYLRTHLFLFLLIINFEVSFSNGKKVGSSNLFPIDFIDAFNLFKNKINYKELKPSLNVHDNQINNIDVFLNNLNRIEEIALLSQGCLTQVQRFTQGFHEQEEWVIQSNFLLNIN